MAGRGPAPKDPAKRRRRNATPPTTVVVPDDELRGPDLPAGVEWHEMTREWWDTWRRSAQAQTMTATDWSFLRDTALMHDAMWSKGQWTLAAEVRLRVAKFGATPEDRARLRIQVDQPVKPTPPAEPQQAGGRYAHLRAVSE